MTEYHLKPPRDHRLLTNWAQVAPEADVTAWIQQNTEPDRGIRAVIEEKVLGRATPSLDYTLACHGTTPRVMTELWARGSSEYRIAIVLNERVGNWNSEQAREWLSEATDWELTRWAVKPGIALGDLKKIFQRDESLCAGIDDLSWQSFAIAALGNPNLMPSDGDEVLRTWDYLADKSQITRAKVEALEAAFNLLLVLPPEPSYARWIAAEISKVAYLPATAGIPNAGLQDGIKNLERVFDRWTPGDSEQSHFEKVRRLIASKIAPINDKYPLQDWMMGHPDPHVRIGGSVSRSFDGRRLRRWVKGEEFWPRIKGLAWNPYFHTRWAWCPGNDVFRLLLKKCKREKRLVRFGRSSWSVGVSDTYLEWDRASQYFYELDPSRFRAPFEREGDPWDSLVSSGYSISEPTEMESIRARVERLHTLLLFTLGLLVLVLAVLSL